MNTHPRPISERMMACFRMADLTPREQIVLAIIAYHDGDGGAWPSLAKLASQAKIARSTVADVVKSLRHKGRLWVTGSRTTNRYTVAYDVPFDQPQMTVRERLTVRRNPSVSKESTVSGNPAQSVSGNPVHELSTQGASMETNTPKAIGWCRECGGDRVAGDDGCVSCGFEEKPFIVPENEQRTGVITLPFGIAVSGLDSTEARRLFLSEQGQAALEDAYRVVLGTLDNRGAMQ